jgi:hypothetical protein
MNIAMEVEGAIGDLPTKPEEFREQVQRLRKLRDKMRDDGVMPEDKQFGSPLKGRLEIARRLVITGIRTDR